jgi:hypothetical protein
MSTELKPITRQGIGIVILTITNKSNNSRALEPISMYFVHGVIIMIWSQQDNQI